MGALLLLFSIAVVALAVDEALARVGERRWSITVSLALAVLAVLPAELGRPFDDVSAGLGLTALALSWPAWLGVRRRRGEWRGVGHVDVAALIVIIVVVVLGAWVSFGARLWDGALAHYGFSMEIARGVLPPEHPLHPGPLLRYHLGFDVIVALVVAHLGLGVGFACELVSTGLLLLLCFVLRDAGRALGGATAGVLAILVVPLGYGATSLCLAEGWGAEVGACSALFPSSWVGAPRMPPAVVSNFFQHPQGLAMPIAVSLLLVGCTRPTTAKSVLCAVGLALLSHAQIVFFACTGLAIGVVTTMDALLNRRLGVASLRATALLLACAWAWSSGLLGGGATSELRLGSGYFAQDSAWGLVLHHLALFGLTVLALPAALWRMRAEPRPLRAALFIAALAGFVVANVATYARSWDIVKFFAVGAFFANLLLADLLAVLWDRRAMLARLACALLVIVAIGSASFWLVRHGPLNGVIAFRYALSGPSPLGEALWRAHGKEMGARDIVLTSDTDIWHLGFFTVGADWRTECPNCLIDRKRADADKVIARRALRHLGARDLALLRVDWLLLGPADRKRLSPAGRAALEEGERIVFVEDVVVGAAHWQLFRVMRPQP